MDDGGNPRGTPDLCRGLHHGRDKNELKLLAWLAAFFELVLIAGFLTGAYFSETALLAAVYVLFLGFAFHGPSHWTGNQTEFGFFVDHFTFIAGLLFAAAYGPGQILAMNRGWIARQ